MVEQIHSNVRGGGLLLVLFILEERDVIYDAKHGNNLTLDVLPLAKCLSPQSKITKPVIKIHNEAQKSKKRLQSESYTLCPGRLSSR
jgi:hypothetical protein